MQAADAGMAVESAVGAVAMKDFAEAKIRFLAGANAASGPLAKSSAHLWLAGLYLDQDKQLAPAEAEYRKARALVPANQKVIEALKRIGVMFRRKDDRIDMPDLFRVAAKLLKKGGTAPIH